MVRTKISILAYIGLALLGCAYSDPSIPFDSDQWKKSDPTTRFRMIDDLCKNYRHKIMGHSKHEVIELLGEPGLDDPIHANPNQFIMMYDISDTTYSECPCILDITYDSTETISDMSWRDM